MFEITFGVTDVGDESFNIQTADADIEKPLFKGEVLICEDNNMNQRVIAEHLERVGLGSEIAENGKEGVEIALRRMEEGKKPFDLILMDIHMPVMDGIEAAPKIIEAGVESPVIAMTANVMKEDIELYKKIGMKEHIGKPFTSQELWRVLLRHIKPVSFTKAKEPEREQTENNLQRQLKTAFLRDNINKFSEIAEALDAKDIKLAHRLAHTLKSNAGLLGKKALQDAAADVEKSLDKGKNLVNESQLGILSVELNIVLDELKDYFAKAGKDNKIEKATGSFVAYDYRELFNKLELLLESGSPECLNLIDELRAIPESRDLIDQMEDFDFDAAAETFAKMKKTLLD